MGVFWSPLLATVVGVFAFYTWRVTVPGAIRQIEGIKQWMPTKQIHFENKIRGLQRWRRAVGMIVAIQVVLSIVLWAQYIGR